jgi:helicase-like protein
MRQKALVICPAALRDMRERELRDATIPAEVVSQEDLGRWEEVDVGVVDCDVILVDESHNFRNSNAQRYQNLERLIAANGGRGRDGGPKKVLLLTATPINNNLIDLYNQINLFTRSGDRAYFAAAGIGDLHRYFLNARRAARQDGSAIALFNLLEEVVIRRTRPFIRRAYIARFAPRASKRLDLVGSAEEIDVLVSTDVLSEGQNLQDCWHLRNYDLHWNPTRMVQRAGRIDRIGTGFDTLWICNMFPDRGLSNCWVSCNGSPNASRASTAWDCSTPASWARPCTLATSTACGGSARRTAR